MSLQFKSKTTSPSPIPARNNNKLFGKVAGAPIGMPVVGTSIRRDSTTMGIKPPPNLPPLPMPGAGVKRAVNYYADYSGCGWWRMIMPEQLMGLEQKGIVSGLTTMVLDERFYHGINAVKLQRQASPYQLDFFKYIKGMSERLKFKTIYEIDDVIFKDDIPEFNRCRAAFEDPVVTSSSLEMMQLADEISVTCQFMKEYYAEKTGNKNITVIPNYPSRMWMDGHYNPHRIGKLYTDNKKQPRIAYIGSGTHIDVGNKTNQRDDFYHVVNHIIKTRKIFKWVFIGCFPLPCKPFIDRGEMEFVSWFPLKDLAQAYIQTNCQAVYAPLMDCTFNKAKSNIKYLEAATCGIPGVFQDLCTYEDAPLRFKTGDELIDQLKHLTSDSQTYLKYSAKARAYADTMWLDDHLDEHAELLFTNIRTPERKTLLKRNPDQVTTATYENPLLHR